MKTKQRMWYVHRVLLDNWPNEKTQHVVVDTRKSRLIFIAMIFYEASTFFVQCKFWISELDLFDSNFCVVRLFHVSSVLLLKITKALRLRIANLFQFLFRGWIRLLLLLEKKEHTLTFTLKQFRIRTPLKLNSIKLFSLVALYTHLEIYSHE